MAVATTIEELVKNLVELGFEKAQSSVSIAEALHYGMSSVDAGAQMVPRFDDSMDFTKAVELRLELLRDSADRLLLLESLKKELDAISNEGVNLAARKELGEKRCKEWSNYMQAVCTWVQNRLDCLLVPGKEPGRNLTEAALIFHYRRTPITEDNCQEIASKYGYNNKSSGQTLLDHYRSYERGENNWFKRQKRSVLKIKAVLLDLHGAAKKRALNDLQQALDHGNPESLGA